MNKISFSGMGMGIYSYACAVRELFFLPSSFQKMEAEHKIRSIVDEALSRLFKVVATSSSAVLWTHSVGIISLGPYLRLVEQISCGAFSLFYGKEAYQERSDVSNCSLVVSSKGSDEAEELLQSHLWKLVGNVSFLAWSVLGLMQAAIELSVNPIIPLFLLTCGIVAFTLSHLYGESAGKIREILNSPKLV